MDEFQQQGVKGLQSHHHRTASHILGHGIQKYSGYVDAIGHHRNDGAASIAPIAIISRDTWSQVRREYSGPDCNREAALQGGDVGLGNLFHSERDRAVLARVDDVGPSRNRSTR